VRSGSAASLVVAVATAAAVGFAVPPGDTGDFDYFVQAAGRMLSASWAETYSSSTLQAGPLELLLFGLSSPALVGAAAGAVAAGLFWLVARRLLGDVSAWALLAAGLAPVALGLTFHAYRQGHPAQVIVPLLWVLAGIESRRGRPWLAGVLVGASAGFELWGILGVAAFAAAPRVGAVVRATACAALVTLALYAPFALAGEFAMFEYRWMVNGDTLLSLFVEPGTAFTWPLRVLQGGTAVCAGAAVAWSLRRSAAAFWVAPLVLVAVRLALDPVRYPWYWLALETLALVGAVELARTLVNLRAREAARRAASRGSRAPRPAPRSAPRTS
jgi:hypothetical protein